jgi:hypothetical protein
VNDPARGARHLPWIALVPPLVIALLVFGLGVDVPYWDTWDWLDRHYPADHGAVSMLRRYWTPFNGHRVFLPLLLDRMLLELSAIDMWPRICAKLLLSLATLAALLAMVRSTLAHVPIWVTGAVAALAFPLAYWPMWMDPRQFSLHIVVLCMITALRVADSARPTWARLVLSGLLCVAASVSYGPGILTWPFVALVLWTRDRRPPALALAAWTIAASALLALQVHDASLEASVATTAAPAFVSALVGALVVAGSPVTLPIPLAPNVPALLMGATGLVILAVCATRAWRGTSDERRHAMPWVALGAWAAAYAGTVGAARGGLPLGALRDPRFAYLAALLWVAILVLLAQGRNSSERGSSRTRHTAAAVTAIVFAGIAMGSVRPFVARRGITALSRQLATGRDCLRRYATADSACLALLHPSPDRVRAIAARLDARGAAFLRTRDQRDNSEGQGRKAMP